MTDDNGNQSSDLDEAYEDRNLLALLSLYLLKQLDYNVGWREDEELSNEWVIVYAELSKIYTNKQISFHVPRSLVKSAPWLYKGDKEWDGHDREEKNNRIRDFIGLNK